MIDFVSPLSKLRACWYVRRELAVKEELNRLLKLAPNSSALGSRVVEWDFRRLLEIMP